MRVKILPIVISGSLILLMLIGFFFLDARRSAVTQPVKIYTVPDSRPTTATSSESSMAVSKRTKKTPERKTRLPKDSESENFDQELEEFLSLLESFEELPVEEGTSEASPEAEASTEEAEIEGIKQFANEKFDAAVKLYEEKWEIYQRRSRVRLSNGRVVFTRPSPEVAARLQEMQYEIYDLLSAINEKVPGAAEVRLVPSSDGSGVGCEKYLFPQVFEERLGVVPEGYYRFERALLPFLEPPMKIPGG